MSIGVVIRAVCNTRSRFIETKTHTEGEEIANS